jgi:hypothetical protein
MLFAGSTWSELPVSTSKEQDLNGELFGYEFIIDQILPLDLEIEEEEDFELKISQESKLNVDLKR